MPDLGACYIMRKAFKWVKGETIRLKRPFIPFQRKAAILLAALLILSGGVLLGYNFYIVSSNMNRQLEASSTSTLSLFSSWLRTGLESVDSYLLYLTASDQDFAMLSYQDTFLESHLCAYQVKEKCDMVLKTEKTADAFFLFSSPSGYFTKTYGSGASSQIQIYSGDYMKRLLSSGSAPSQDWTLHWIEGVPCLIRIMSRGGASIAVLVDLQQISQSSPEAARFLGSFVFFGEDGALLTMPENPDVSDVRQYRGGHLLSGGDGSRYYVAEEELGFAGLRAAYLAPYPAIWESFDGTLLLLFAFSLVVLGMIWLCFILLRRFIFSPLDQLTAIMGKVCEGNLEARIQPRENIREFEKIYEAFNTMMDQIHSLKLAAYEKKIEAERAELQYLQIQIRPHFYLNCLKNLYSMAQAKKYDNMQRMILALSEYLRDMLHIVGETIPLSAELRSVENYILLQQIVASRPPVCSLQVEEGLLQFPVPPLSLLTFVENSVKHASSPEKQLHIQVKASRVGEGREQFVNLTVYDDGRGFPPQVLQCLNGTQTEESTQIGISNVKRRCALLYGSRYAFSFYNRDGSCAELFLPCGLEEKGRKNDDCSDR